MYDYSATAVKLLNIAMIVILVVGIIGGIASGVALRTPTEDALEAQSKLTLYPTATDRYEWTKAAKEKQFGILSIVTLFSFWISSAFCALMLLCKRVQLEQLEVLVGYKQEEEDRRRKKELEEARQNGTLA